MQRIMNMSNWTHMGPEDELPFDVARPRSVSIEVNAANKTRIYYVCPDGELVFLALVEGRDKVEFQTETSFKLIVDQPDTFIYSDDGIAVHHVSEAPETFTKVMAGRRQRNPEVEYMVHQMSKNFDRMLSKQARQHSDQLERAFAMGAAQSAPASAPAGPAKEPEPDAAGPDGKAAAAGASGGSEGKG